MKNKKSFILYTDNKVQIDMLSDAQAGKLMKAIFEYMESGNMPSFDDGMLSIVFSFISAQIKRDSEKYEEICKKRAENGRKGGRPQKEANGFSEKQMKAKKANGFFEKQTKAKKADNDTDTDIVTDNDTDTDIVNDSVIVNDIVTENNNDNDRISDASAFAEKKEQQQQATKKNNFLFYGKYGNIRLTSEQYKTLCTEFGESTITDYIRRIDEWMQLKGNTYNDCELAIRQWIERDRYISPKKNNSHANIDFSEFINKF